MAGPEFRQRVGTDAGVRRVRGDNVTHVGHLTNLAAKLWKSGISPDALRAALQAENEMECNPPLDPEEVEQIAASVMKYPPGAPTGSRSDAAEALMRLVLDQAYEGGRHLTFDSDGQFWSYNKKFWQPVSDPLVQGRILETIPKLPVEPKQNTAPLIQQTMFLLKTKLATKEDHLSFINDPPPVINCANGELWIDQKGNVELRPHRPESFLRHCLNVEFDPKATCPIYDRAIVEIFSRADHPEALVRHWNELTGYIIQPRRHIPMIIILFGRGSNGKGVLMRTAIRLLGEHLVYAQPVESFENSRFAKGSLFGKYLYVDDDVRAGVKLPDGFLKTISEAKLVTGEPKFKSPFNFIVRTLPFLLCNNVPSLPDLSHGFHRRLRVIPFDRTFTDDDKDETLFERIWATELSGILNRALSGLQRLASRGYRFAWPKSVLAATQRFIQDANPLPAFIASCCQKGSGDYCRLKDFYDAFCAWADENGITLKQQKLSVRKNLEHMGYPVRHRNDGERIFGLSLNGNPHT